MPNNKYFDFHFHPLFKQMLCNWEDQYPSKVPLNELVENIDLQNYLLEKIDAMFLNILGNQSSVTQLQKGNVLLGVANIVALEFGFADSRKGFGAILQSKITAPLDLRHFSSVRESKTSYYRMFLHELSMYRNLVALTKNGTHPVKFLTRKQKQAIGDNDIIFALGIEGGHNLCRDLVAKKGWSDVGTAGANDDALWKDFCSPLSAPAARSAESLKRLHAALWKENLDLLYVTLTHLTHIDQQLLANHAFGMKMLNHASFFPQGYGLEQEGKDFITAAYEMKADGKSTPVLIDTKHMSLKSRMDFYDYRRQNGYTHPIIASHVGVTGYTLAEWKLAKAHAAPAVKEGVKVNEVVTEPKHCGTYGSIIVKDKYHFNPWSINLMDEDIEEVIESKGMIGVSLDVRILGFESRLGKLLSGEHAEYLSINEYNWLFGRGTDTDTALVDTKTAEEALIPGKDTRQPLALCFNIVHILAVGKRMGLTDTWKYISIGSDFDGLVNPVQLAEDCSLRPALESTLMRWLPVAERAYDQEHGSGALLPGVNGTQRSMNTEPDLQMLKAVVRGVLYENGRSFLYNWYGADVKQPLAVEAMKMADVPVVKAKKESIKK
jgi:microsomal dipeptidase-like Zn-dependent dipeptidase